MRAGKDNFLHIHVSFIVVVHGEQKTKPTQNTIQDVRERGLNPDIVCSFAVATLKTNDVRLPAAARRA